MATNQFLFWILASAGSIAAGWWLAVRPELVRRDVASPASFLIIVMAVLLCLLALTGQDLTGFVADVQHFTLGGVSRGRPG